MMLCEKHGGEPAMVVSNDAIDTNGNVSQEIKLIQVDFEIDGKPMVRYYLSPANASRFGLKDVSTFPMEDELPAWVDEIKWSAVCLECYRESRSFS